jgi:hypothetical protein
MIWYNEQLVRALQRARLAERRPRASRVPRTAPSSAGVTVALRPAPVR